LAVRVDAVDTFEGTVLLVELVLAGVVAVTRVREIDTAFGVDGQVVGLVEGLAAERIGEDDNLAFSFGARDTPAGRLTGEQTALAVEEQAVSSGVFAVDSRLAVAVELHDMAIATGQDAEFGVPGRPFPAGAGGGLDFQPDARLENGLIFSGRR
jgi:hypothetical protein